jgi:hypothetical protein
MNIAFFLPRHSYFPPFLLVSDAIMRFFHAMDRDESKTITRAEWLAGLRTLGLANSSENQATESESTAAPTLVIVTAASAPAPTFALTTAGAAAVATETESTAAPPLAITTAPAAAIDFEPTSQITSTAAGPVAFPPHRVDAADLSPRANAALSDDGSIGWSARTAATFEQDEVVVDGVGTDEMKSPAPSESNYAGSEKMETTFERDEVVVDGDGDGGQRDLHDDIGGHVAGAGFKFAQAKKSPRAAPS